MSSEQLTDDALNRRAAELMGWTSIPQFASSPNAIGMGSHYWVKPDGRKVGSRSEPRPATDYGDALRFADFLVEHHNMRVKFGRDCCTYRWCNIEHVNSDGDHQLLVVAYADTLPLAITRACIAALEAAREEGAK